MRKKKTFRKPFEAYAKAPHYTTAKQPETYKDGHAPRSRENSNNSFRQSSTNSFRDSQNDTMRSRDSRPGGSFRDTRQDPYREMHSRQNSYREHAEGSSRGSRSGYAQSSLNDSLHKRSYREDYAQTHSPNPHASMRRAASPNPMMARDPLFHPTGHRPRSPNPPPPIHSSYHPPAANRAHLPNPISHRAYSPNPMSINSSYSPDPMSMPRSHSPNHMTMDRTNTPNPLMMDRTTTPNPSMMNRSYSPNPMMNRAPSPNPMRAPSPQPSIGGFGSRGPSPSPSFSFKPYRPGAEREPSPPPPMPPPHRHVKQQDSMSPYDQLARQNSHNSYDSRQYETQPYPEPLGRQNSNASYNDNDNTPRAKGHHTPRATSPAPPSPAGDGFTPSPLREAMDDVYKELDALGMPQNEREQSPQEPLNPWSPESFDMVHHRSKKRHQVRPLTSIGFSNMDEGYETYSGSGESSRDPTYHGSHREDQGLPKLDNYVERMESQLKKMHVHNSRVTQQDEAPAPPPKGGRDPFERPQSSMSGSVTSSQSKLRARKSAYDVLGRTFTTKTTSTNASSGNQSTATESTNRSLMSGVSAGAFSATSAGSLARKQPRSRSAFGMRDDEPSRPDSPVSGVTYHSSHASQNSQARPQSQAGFQEDPMMGVGGLVQPTKKKRGLFGKIRDMAKTGVASGRNTIVATGSAKPSPMSSMSLNKSFTGLPGGTSFRNSVHGNGHAARDVGLGSGAVDWVQVRRDVNRSNTLSRNERSERRDRCQMLDYPAINPVDDLFADIEGDEGIDGIPVHEPTNYQSLNLCQVDKNSRFISGLPPMTTAITLATQYVCRPFRSDVQRLRAIFTWVAEKITWEEDFEGQIDTRKVVQNKRGCSEEYAVLVAEMCAAVGLQCEIVRGYLKTPGEIPECNIMPRSNHWWNCVTVDNEWRIMDCSLASPSNPRRALYSAGISSADPWWFLARPTEACWTHIPEHSGQQHICPPVAHEILLNLPCACPPYFKNSMDMVEYNTSLTRIEDLEMAHIQFTVPPDVEVAAEVEVKAFSRDMDGDYFESGDILKKRALAQAEWFNGAKRYTIKALLPGDEGTGMLKVYAGKRGLMHSIKDIPHPLAFALPIIHSGENPPYDFVRRHPTPHAQRHDIYVVQPQCWKLALNNTFVFAIRQHPSNASASAMTPSSNPGNASPVPFARPSSALSMTASSVSGSNASSSATGYAGSKKPAKLAIQTPGGKILRLMRKEEKRAGIGVGGRSAQGEEDVSDGGTWETIIKCSERGVWRGLVLADRTARWCVFAEWDCV
ncbi:cytokinesis protein 3 [Zalerion maritima]|uniref:Cytokinesis protein 3 n=1 Tax=Zalerion maritima TaxID=339359 RepID=A0AAD5S0E6_9PEZI|nr:cytokinesis protein 3 [Zalerion maritima]